MQTSQEGVGVPFRKQKKWTFIDVNSGIIKHDLADVQFIKVFTGRIYRATVSVFQLYLFSSTKLMKNAVSLIETSLIMIELKSIKTYFK